MAENRETADSADIDPVAAGDRRERPTRRHHDETNRTGRAVRDRWRFSSAVEAARHLGSTP